MNYNLNYVENNLRLFCGPDAELNQRSACGWKLMIHVVEYLAN